MQQEFTSPAPPSAASHNRIAFSRIAANTGARSPGESVDDLQRFLGRSLFRVRFCELGGALDELLLQLRDGLRRIPAPPRS
jgi:hypothetical protein